MRGLDYYSRTVFEWVTTELGSQDAVCSGGRYDGLVAQLGGDQTSAMGWALGEERIINLMQTQGVQIPANQTDVYIVLAGVQAEAAGLSLVERLRDQIPGCLIETNCGGGSFKSQLKRADKSGARYAVILGDSEAAQQVAILKNLRVESAQEQVTWALLAETLRQRLAN